jgi:hypothetical protein
VTRVPQPRPRPQPYSLHYVCKFCGASVARYPHIASETPCVMTFCERAECRRQAATEYAR